MKDHRQVVKCEARNPCYAMFNNKTPKGVTETFALFSVAAFGAWFTIELYAGVPLRFTTCLWSIVLSGLSKPA